MLDWQIILIFILLIATLASFAMEKIPPDLTAMSLFAVLIVTGLLPVNDALRVFSNPAPIAVAGMFIISAALERCGAIDLMAARLNRLPIMGYSPLLLCLMLPVATVSAFINNTPVVVVFLPIVLSLARRMKIHASKLLIPLSYASIFGGSCTLIGTSTNILVSSVGSDRGLESFHMFELAWVGIPILIAGTFYLILFGPKLLPVRETLSSILSEDERREYLLEAFVHDNSALINKTVKEALGSRRSLRILEVIRDGVALRGDIASVELQGGDRLVMAARPKGVAEARALHGIDLSSELGEGVEAISSSEGIIVEAVIGPQSSIIGKTIPEINFRQRFRMVVLAIHRRGRNLRSQIDSVELEFGDTLLLLGTENAVKNLQTSNDIITLDRPPVPAQDRKNRLPLVIAAIAAVVGGSALGLFRIEAAAIVACVFLFLTGCVTPKEGYKAIQWNILFIIFGMLGMGAAMELTGASKLLANQIDFVVSNFVAEPLKPMVLLALVYLLTSFLTEILSNNAAAVLVAVLAIGLAETLGVDPKPFLIAVAMAASASFATPIGYQTNTYVYGIGGYRFSDFIKVGIPLNVLSFIVSITVIPMVWDF